MAKLELSWPQINRTPANYCKSTEKNTVIDSNISIVQKNPFFQRNNNKNDIDVVLIKLCSIELPQRGESAHLSIVKVRFI